MDVIFLVRTFRAAIGGSTLKYFKVLADYKTGYFDFALIED